MDNLKIVVIDDNQELLESLKASLELERFSVSTAATGHDGVARVIDVLPDIVLLDVRLPDLDGFQVCESIRHNAATAKIPVILITGDHTVDIDRGFDAGADDCIMKPVDISFLTRRILKLVHRTYQIMVIEDDRQITEMLARLFADQGWEAVVLHDGTTLRQSVESARPDLILLDINLPSGPDGVEMCRILKKDSETRQIPVIMLTSNENIPMVEKCFEYGAEDYVFKPFNLPDLLLRVRKYIKPADAD